MSKANTDSCQIHVKKTIKIISFLTINCVLLNKQCINFIHYHAQFYTNIKTKIKIESYDIHI